MVAADQRVVGLVEEVRIAEIEGQRLVTAGVDVGMNAPPITHREGLTLHAVEHHHEAHAVPLDQTSRVGEYGYRREPIRFQGGILQEG